MVTPGMPQASKRNPAQEQAREAVAGLQEPTVPEAMNRLLWQAFAHLGLQSEALQAALRDSRLTLSGIEVALAPDLGGEVLVAAADLGNPGQAGPDGKRRALRTNAHLMLHACLAVARGLAGPDSTQLVGRLHTPGRPAAEVAHWLGSFAGLARSIRETPPRPAGCSSP